MVLTGILKVQGVGTPLSLANNRMRRSDSSLQLFGVLPMEVNQDAGEPVLARGSQPFQGFDTKSHSRNYYQRDLVCLPQTASLQYASSFPWPKLLHWYCIEAI